MPEVVGMLRNIGTAWNPALRQSTGMDYAAFEQRIGEHLAEVSGN